MVAQQTLTLYVRVRILHPLPNSGTSVPEFFYFQKTELQNHLQLYFFYIGFANPFILPKHPRQTNTVSHKTPERNVPVPDT